MREKENPLAFVNYCLSVHELTRQCIYTHSTKHEGIHFNGASHPPQTGGEGGGWIFDLQNHFSVETHCHTLIIECIVDANWEDPSDANCMTNTVIRSIKCIHCNNHAYQYWRSLNSYHTLKQRFWTSIPLLTHLILTSKWKYYVIEMSIKFNHLSNYLIYV